MDVVTLRTREDKWFTEVGDPKVVRNEGGNKTERKVEEKREEKNKTYLSKVGQLGFPAM